MYRHDVNRHRMPVPMSNEVLQHQGLRLAGKSSALWQQSILGDQLGNSETPVVAPSARVGMSIRAVLSFLVVSRCVHPVAIATQLQTLGSLRHARKITGLSIQL